jgi:hypothetical protein
VQFVTPLSSGLIISVSLRAFRSSARTIASPLGALSLSLSRCSRFRPVAIAFALGFQVNQRRFKQALKSSLHRTMYQYYFDSSALIVLLTVPLIKTVLLVETYYISYLKTVEHFPGMVQGNYSMEPHKMTQVPPDKSIKLFFSYLISILR